MAAVVYVPLPSTPAGWTLASDSAGTPYYTPTVSGSSPAMPDQPDGYIISRLPNGNLRVTGPAPQPLPVTTPAIAAGSPTAAVTAIAGSSYALPIALLAAGFVFKKPWWGAAAAAAVYLVQKKS